MQKFLQGLTGMMLSETKSILDGCNVEVSCVIVKWELAGVSICAVAYGYAGTACFTVYSDGKGEISRTFRLDNRDVLFFKEPECIRGFDV